MSSCAIAIVAAEKAVTPPKSVISINTTLLNSNKDEHLIIKKIPAVTNVAACINAETGVGASIASGNQVCSPIWADFPIEPINKKKLIISKHKKFIFNIEKVALKKKGAMENTIAKSTDLK
jgi:hypothetical protein